MVSGNPSNYGTMGQPFQPNYLTHPDLDRAPLLADSSDFVGGNMPSAAMNPAMTPYPPAVTAAAHAIGPEGPTAPPPEWADFPGYENMGTGDDGGKVSPPPNLGPISGDVPMPAETNWTIPFISEDTARKALLDYAKNKCCYRTAPAVEMDFHELQPYNTYRYRLETFAESRSCKWVSKPYNGETVDSTGYGPPPMPWHIPIPVPAMFIDDKLVMPVPHTSSVKPCPKCLGICRTLCKQCHGAGRERCWVCSGTGRRMNDPCNRCGALGSRSCSVCHGLMYEKCTGCLGRGQILHYIQLTVIWKNNIYEHVMDHNSDFPTELFNKVNGEKVFTDEQLRLPPLVNFPVPAINQASQNGLQQHQTQFASLCKILRQRHTIEWLALTKVEYVWRGKPYHYFVYGKENKVYADDYPQKCCCVVM
ncbi:protein SSUH2 homolog isoform X2 [Hyperolius riggenbachi]|uniref:protein SSUH2 homolog isoform X2 n=1 Tax=Hyperolius riggenbachi TaxID=752182 RepID=UPI0035A2CBA4